MKLYVLSDLHLEFAAFVPDPAAAAAADVIVLAGDIDQGTKGLVWARQTFPKQEIVYVAGNHEFYNHNWVKLLDDMRSQAATLSIHFLEDQAVTLDGVRFLGATLWTDYDYFGRARRLACMRLAEQSLNDFVLIKASTLQPEKIAEILGTVTYKNAPVRWSRKLTAAHTLERHQASLGWLKTELANSNPDRTVVVSHHFAHPNSCAPQYAEDPLTAIYGSRLPYEVLLRPGLWIHGHTHESQDYRLESEQSAVRVVCNPRGYPLSRLSNAFENKQFNPALLVEI